MEKYNTKLKSLPPSLGLPNAIPGFGQLDLSLGVFLLGRLMKKETEIKRMISLQLHRELMERERRNNEFKKKIIEIARKERERHEKKL